MTSLRDLTLPQQDTSSSSPCGDDPCLPSPSFRSIGGSNADVPHASIARHALAHGCTVIGMRRCSGSDKADKRESFSWISWQTSFSPTPVCRVASSASAGSDSSSGGIVAVSTADGHISLLRGTKGDILARRSVMPRKQLSDDALLSPKPPIELVFVSCSEKFRARDALIIMAPTHVRECDGVQISNEQPFYSVILVSGIDGSSLNSSTPSLVSEAATKMSIDGLTFDLDDYEATQEDKEPINEATSRNASPTRRRVNITTLNGCFMSPYRIRFIVCDTLGKISVHDYSVEEKTTKVISRSISLDPSSKETSINRGNDRVRWSVDASLGIKVDSHCRFGPLFCISVRWENEVKLCWYDFFRVELLCEYSISSVHDGRLHHPILLAMEPILTFSNESAVGMAIAIKKSQSTAGAIVQVVQAALDYHPIPKREQLESTHLSTSVTEAKPDGLITGKDSPSFKISHPHVVYRLPYDPTLVQSSLVQIDIVSTDVSPYSIKYVVALESGSLDCKEFTTDQEKAPLGKFRLLLSQGLFYAADKFLLEAGSFTSEHASMHGSDVALCQLRALLTNGNAATSSSMEAMDCLRRLKGAAVSSGPEGVQRLLEAAKSVSEWGRSAAQSKTKGPSIRQFRKAIAAVFATVSDALKAAPSVHTDALRQQRAKLASQASALKILDDVVFAQSSSSSKESHTLHSLPLEPRLSTVTSSADLFRVLVSDGAFLLADNVRRADSKTVSFEVVAETIMSLPYSVDPLYFRHWLKDIVIPQLAVEHPLLIKLRTWACRAANAHDDECNFGGLSASIVLLKAVCDATAELSTRAYLSSSTYCRTTEGASQAPKRNSSTEHNTSNDGSFSSIYSKSAEMNSMTSIPAPTFTPTVLQLGLLQKRSPFARKLASAKRIRPLRSLSSENSSPGSEVLKLHRQDDDDGDDDDCEKKLREANVLKHARTLGIDRNVVSLRSFMRLGGPSFIAMELVRFYSSSSSSLEERVSKIQKFVIPFAEEHLITLDDAIEDYTKELCEASGDNSEVLCEVLALARCCIGPKRKCLMALKGLRAALFCAEVPTLVSTLAKEALEWSNETTDEIRSELQEASRLILIDSIVRRYCGNRAREFFRVSDPRHGQKLLRHVCRFVREPRVMVDALALCDAFTHLSRVEAGVLILRRTMLSLSQIMDTANVSSSSSAETSGQSVATEQGPEGCCGAHMQKLYEIDKTLAERVGAHVVAFACETIHGCTVSLRQVNVKCITFKKQRTDAEAACSSACSILAVMQENENKASTIKPFLCGILTKLGAPSWKYLLREMRRLSKLQTDFSIYLTLSELRTAPVRGDMLVRLFDPAIELIVSSADKNHESLRAMMARAKRGCNLLYGADPSEAVIKWLWAVGLVSCHLVDSDDQACFDFLEACQILDDTGQGNKSSKAASTALVSIAKFLCGKAASFVEDLRANKSEFSDDFTEDWQEVQDTSKKISHSMKCIVRAASLLQEYGIMNCSEKTINSVISVSGLTDLLSQVFVRSDGGTGEDIDCFQRKLREVANLRRRPNSNDRRNNKTVIHLSLPPPPLFHPSWYVGDGLLLPPLQSLRHCVIHCSQQLKLSTKSCGAAHSAKAFRSSEDNIFRFLNMGGAHYLSLRLLSTSMSVYTSRHSLIASHDGDIWMATYEETMRHLAERSLGGSGNGLMNGTIDSELAVAHLLSLPTKLAFKVYLSALPSATSRRDFSRVLTLSTIGVQAGTGGSSNEKIEQNGVSCARWKNQTKFLSQCRRWASNAQWWQVLQWYGIDFDPRLFNEEDAPTDSRVMTSRKASDYASSLIAPLIGSASQVASTEEVMELAGKYCRSFALDPHDAAPKKHIEFLLSWPTVSPFTGDFSTDEEHTVHDLRQDIDMCEVAAKTILRLLPTCTARSAVLRRCVINLQNTEKSGSDYERHSLVLSLYRSELAAFLRDSITENGAGTKLLQNEFMCIGRRLDVLAVLASFFKGERLPLRPNYLKMFSPLPDSFDESDKKTRSKTCGVIGKNGGSSDADLFDPLEPLLPVLSEDYIGDTATACAPICHSLGLPQGYVHARWLHGRFLRAKATGSQLPSFEDTVLPILERLKKAVDAVELAEWCALQYAGDESERLACLEKAHVYAMAVSQEAERNRECHPAKAELAEEEQRALDTVKRVGDDLAELKDKVKVKKILKRQSGRTYLAPDVKKHLSELVDAVARNFSGKKHMSPEHFLEGLLSHASMIAAEAALDEKEEFSMVVFRRVASRVHGACAALAEEHSHVYVGKCARALARKWLVHSDTITEHSVSPDQAQSLEHRVSTGLPYISSKSSHGEPTVDFDEDDTADFVMDLNAAAQEVWSDDVGSDRQSKKIDNITVGEEPSAFTSKGSGWERADYVNARTALRIAFVVAFAKDYFIESGRHRYPEHDFSNENVNDNRMNRSAVPSHVRTDGKSLKAKSGDVVNIDTATEHARYLLNIVFAKSGGSVWKQKLKQKSSKKEDTEGTDVQVSLAYQHSKDDNVGVLLHDMNELIGGRTMTFAMRDRALRVAFILCPREVLDSVIAERGYFTEDDGSRSCSLERCRFGTYVAMEIEAMGLPLPHSDLVQLSMMHFSSYARALWRHHGKNECRGYKGRLLHLLLDMCTRKKKIGDAPLVVALLSEITKLDTPRTLLSVCERILLTSGVASQRVELISSAVEGEGQAVLYRVARKTSIIILRELQHTSPAELNFEECIFVIARLKWVLVELGYFGIGLDQFGSLAIEFCELSALFCDYSASLSHELLESSFEFALKMPLGSSRVETFRKIAQINGGVDLLKERCSGLLRKNDESDDLFSGNLLQNLEISLSKDIYAAIEKVQEIN